MKKQKKLLFTILSTSLLLSSFSQKVAAEEDILKKGQAESMVGYTPRKFEVKQQKESNLDEEKELTGTFGTSPWRYEADNQTLFFGEGKFPKGSINDEIIKSNKLDKKVKKIELEGKILANPNSSYLFGLELLDYGRHTDELDSLEEIKGLSYLNTSEVTNMEGIFCGLTNLKTLNVDNFDTSEVTNMKNMFYDLTNLKTLNVDNFHTSKVTDMKNMFYHLTNLKTLNVDNFDTSNVTNMEGVFCGLTNLKTLNVDNFDTSNVTNMRSMFEGMASLEKINVNNFDTSKVGLMDSMFEGMTNLESLDLSHFNTKNVGHMFRMFANSSNIKELDLSHFESSPGLYYTAEMFKGMTSLKSLDISSFDLNHVKYKLYGWFEDTDSLETIKLGKESYPLSNSDYGGCKLPEKKDDEFTGRWILKDSDPVFGYDSSEAFYSEYDGKHPGTYVREKHPKPGKSLKGTFGTSPWRYEFDNQTLFFEGGKFPEGSINENIVKPNKLTNKIKEIKFVGTVLANPNSSYLFGLKDYPDDTTHELDSLENISLKYLDTSEVTNMTGMFTGLTNLKKLNFDSYFDVTKVTNMRNMFHGLENLEELFLYDWNTNNVTDFSGTFSGLTNLKRIDSVGGKHSGCINISSATTVANMFEGMANVEELDVFTDSWSKTENLTNMSGMFKGVAKIETLDLSYYNTSKVTNMSETFKGMTSLKNLNISGFDLTGGDSEHYIKCRQMLEGTNLDTLTLGKNSYIIDRNIFEDYNLPEKKNNEFSGKWILKDSNPTHSYDSSKSLYLNYDGTHPGTYIRERKSNN